MKKDSHNHVFEEGWTLVTGSDETVLKIELSKIKELTPEEIGWKAKNFITKSEIVQLKFDAHRLTLKYKDAKPREATKALDDCRGLFEKISALPTDEKDAVQRSHEVTFLKSVIQMLRHKAINHDSKARERAAREYVGRGYSSTFLEVAKQNGFRCTYCEANADLLLYPSITADRLNMQTRGKAENLLIVCGTCVWDKGLTYEPVQFKTKKVGN